MSDRYEDAAGYFLDSAVALGSDFSPLEFNFSFLRHRWLSSRVHVRSRVGVSCWSLSHNPAGRAITLAEAYLPLADVELFGCVVPTFGADLWSPIKSTAMPCHYFTVNNDLAFVQQALRLVVDHPYDVVHLSKPRIHNVVFGWLYQLVWGSRVIMDVDDEELGFAKVDVSLDPHGYIREHGCLPSLEKLRTKEWIQLAVGMVRQFDGVTVSNRALQKRYGGEIIPHVRPLGRFRPSKEKRLASRTEFGIPLDKHVVLFFGSPRKHKGIVETAKALSVLGREDVCYVMAGGEPDQALRRELDSISSVQYIFMGPQPYERVPDIVALGDLCVLLQDTKSEVAKFQLPAKLMDALGMGLTVFAQVTPALEDLAEKGAFIPVTEENLPEKLQEYFEQGDVGQGARGRAVFESELCVDAVQPIIQDILSDSSPRRAERLTWEGQLECLLQEGRLPAGVPISG